MGDRNLPSRKPHIRQSGYTKPTCPACGHCWVRPRGGNASTRPEQGKMRALLRVYVEPVDKQRLIELARERGCSLSALVRPAILGLLAEAVQGQR